MTTLHLIGVGFLVWAAGVGLFVSTGKTWCRYGRQTLAAFSLYFFVVAVVLGIQLTTGWIDASLSRTINLMLGGILAGILTETFYLHGIAHGLWGNHR